MIFKRANGPLSGVRTVIVGRNMLDDGAGREGIEKSGERGGRLVVGDDVGHSVPTGPKKGEGGLKTLDISGR